MDIDDSSFWLRVWSARLIDMCIKMTNEWGLGISIGYKNELVD